MEAAVHQFTRSKVFNGLDRRSNHGMVNTGGDDQKVPVRDRSGLGAIYLINQGVEVDGKYHYCRGVAAHVHPAAEEVFTEVVIRATFDGASFHIRTREGPVNGRCLGVNGELGEEREDEGSQEATFHVV